MGEAKRKKLAERALIKVAVCVPSQSMVHADFAVALAGLMLYSASSVSLALINEKGSMITDARNRLVQRSLDFGADYILFVDSDMVFPGDALIRLLTADKDIIGAIYNKRVHPYETLGKLLGGKRDLSAGGVVEAEFMPGGFMLIHTKVFRALMEENRRKQVWFREFYDLPESEPNRLMSEDYRFCWSARKAGFQVWCDLDITDELVHIGEQHVSCRVKPRPIAEAAE